MTETDRNPFVSLRIFGFDQHRLFFGRQTQIDELLLRLDANHMLAIPGQPAVANHPWYGRG